MAQEKCTDALSQLLGGYAAQVERDLAQWMIEPLTPAELAEAMRYCVLGGGKRLRPAVVLMSARAAGGSSDDPLTRRCAAAVEMVHSYSLVHDDLPAMDDDVLRRGRPTAHVKFGQAMAILVGDALLTRAFGVIADGARQRPELAPRLVAELARGAGSAGMIAGQVADMGLCPVPAGAEGLEYIHSRKTAALIVAAARMGALCAAASAEQFSAIDSYAQSLGMSFQLVDDLLDVTGSADELGKTAGKDARMGKRTGVREIGLPASLELVGKLTDQALAALEPLGAAGAELAALATLLAQRTR